MTKARVRVQPSGHVDLDVQPTQHLRGLAIRRFPVDAAPFPRLAADQEVLRHGQIGAEVDLLVHGADAQGLRVQGGSDDDLGAVQGDRAAVLSLGACQDPDERRLAGSVLADERVDLAAREREVHFIEGMHTRKCLVDAVHHDDVGCGAGHVGPQWVCTGVPWPLPSCGGFAR
jgi:hypothetical protein